MFVTTKREGVYILKHMYVSSLTEKNLKGKECLEFAQAN